MVVTMIGLAGSGVVSPLGPAIQCATARGKLQA